MLISHSSATQIKSLTQHYAFKLYSKNFREVLVVCVKKLRTYAYAKEKCINNFCGGIGALQRKPTHVLSTWF